MQNAHFNLKRALYSTFRTSLGLFVPLYDQALSCQNLALWLQGFGPAWPCNPRPHKPRQPIYQKPSDHTCKRMFRLTLTSSPGLGLTRSGPTASRAYNTVVHHRSEHLDFNSVLLFQCALLGCITSTPHSSKSKGKYFLQSTHSCVLLLRSTKLSLLASLHFVDGENSVARSTSVSGRHLDSGRLVGLGRPCTCLELRFAFTH